MKRKCLTYISLIVLLTGGVTYAINQPSIECQTARDIANLNWDSANTAEKLSSDPFISEIFGGVQSPNWEYRYSKSILELRRVAHLYKLSAIKRTLENEECFSQTEIKNAQVQAKVQKSFEAYFAE
jgi:hypothetical protein